MKISIVIISLLFLSRPILPVLEYVINYNYIVAELCENKAKPEMQCNGKCHLKKELAKASENEKPLSQKKAQALETEVLFLQATNIFTPGFAVSIITSQNTITYRNNYCYGSTHFIFRPPLVIS